VSGNHDQPRSRELRGNEVLDPDVAPVTTTEIPQLYGDFGFKDPRLTAYSCDPTPDLHLVGICSAKPNEDGGYISPQVMAWLDDDLAKQRDPGRETIVMLHHSIIDHVPNESVNPTFAWFHVANSKELKALLRKHGVRITFTGHLHIQDVKEEAGLYNIVTSSLAGFPHAYRIITVGDGAAEIRSRRLQSIPSQPDLQRFSRQFTTDVFVDIIAELLAHAPFSYPRSQAESTAHKLREWWPRIADGDDRFAYSADELGDPLLAAYINAFSDGPPPDNDLTIELPQRGA
jgi:hypothetical protein